MKYITVEWSKGVTIIRSELETGSESELTEHEQIINELHSKVEKLNLACITASTFDANELFVIKLGCNALKKGTQPNSMLDHDIDHLLEKIGKAV